jgi:hypothetical protein
MSKGIKLKLSKLTMILGRKGDSYCFRILAMAGVICFEFPKLQPTFEEVHGIQSRPLRTTFLWIIIFISRQADVLVSLPFLRDASLEQVVPANRILLVNDKAKFGRNSNWIIGLIVEPKEDAMAEDVTHIWIAVHGRRVKEMLEALKKQGLPLPTY